MRLGALIPLQYFVAIFVVAEPEADINSALEGDDACTSGDCALNALQMRHVLSETLSDDINFLQWNPHWQCLAKSKDCAKSVVKELDSALADNHIDFANVVELEVDYLPPQGYDTITAVCGEMPKGDMTTLIYNKDVWAKSEAPGAFKKGCMVENNRPFFVQQFESADGRKVVIVAAHFPHPDTDPSTNNNRDSIQAGVKSVTSSTGVDSVVLIADTNEYRNTSNADVLGSIGATMGTVVGTELLDTCCVNHNGTAFESYNGWLTFDRVIANFGNEMVTVELFRNLPSWAQMGEFHTAIKAKLINGTGRHTMPPLQ